MRRKSNLAILLAGTMLSLTACQGIDNIPTIEQKPKSDWTYGTGSASVQIKEDETTVDISDENKETESKSDRITIKETPKSVSELTYDNSDRGMVASLNKGFKNAIFEKFLEKGYNRYYYYYSDIDNRVIRENFDTIDNQKARELVKEAIVANILDVDIVSEGYLDDLQKLDGGRGLKAIIDELTPHRKYYDSYDSSNVLKQSINSSSTPVEDLAGAVMDGLSGVFGGADSGINSMTYESAEMDDYSPSQSLGGYDDDYTYKTAEYNVIDENGFKVAKSSPLSTFSIDVDTAGYTKLKYDILNGYGINEIDKDEVKIEELINYFNFDYSNNKDISADAPFTISTDYTICPWNDEHKILRVGIKANEATDDIHSNFVIVADVSGSMMSLRKLPLALSAYADMLDNLGSDDTVSIIYYADGTGVILEGESCKNKEAIYNGLAETYFAAGGGTNGAVGLDTAYDLARKNFVDGGVNRILLATDGDFNIGRTSSGELKDIVEDGRKKGVYLTILGYGYDNIKDDKMETMAENGNGNYHYIGDVYDARKSLVTEASATLIPMADDVKIQVEFNPATVNEYRLIGYESRMLEAEDFNNDKVDAGEIGAGKSVTALYEIVPVGVTGSNTVPDLKYSNVESTTDSDDICTVSVRYKDINSSILGAKSNLVQTVVSSNDFNDSPTTSTALAMAVAEYGMTIRDSEHKGTSTLESAEEIATKVYKNTQNTEVGELIMLINKLKENG